MASFEIFVPRQRNVKGLQQSSSQLVESQEAHLFFPGLGWDQFQPLSVVCNEYIFEIIELNLIELFVLQNKWPSFSQKIHIRYFKITFFHFFKKPTSWETLLWQTWQSWSGCRDFLLYFDRPRLSSRCLQFFYLSQFSLLFAIVCDFHLRLVGPDWSHLCLPHLLL